MLTRDELIRPRTKKITIDGGTMVIRALTADEAIQLQGKDIKRDDIFGIISKSIVDPALSTEDIGLIPASIMSQITAEVFEFNGLGAKAIKEAQNELKKTISAEQSTK
jgi:hypothetical protein